jgi:hypothetical protein
MHAIDQANVQLSFYGAGGIFSKKSIACFLKIFCRQVRGIVQPDSPGQYFKLIKTKFGIDGDFIFTPDPEKNRSNTYAYLEIIVVMVLVNKRLNQCQSWDIHKTDYIKNVPRRGAGHKYITSAGVL